MLPTIDLLTIQSSDKPIHLLLLFDLFTIMRS